MDDHGASVYDGRNSIFFTAGNDAYYLDETNLWAGQEKLRWLHKYLPAGSRLLDVGASFGHFLHAAHDCYQAEGIELSPAAVAWSREHFGVRNRVGSVYDLPLDRADFDAVTCWDVIEHVPDPWLALGRMAGVLKPAGWLFLSTPDAGSLAAKVLGRRWHYLDPVQHLFLFNRANLAASLRSAGLEIVGMRTFGRRYRLRYVCDRLAQLHAGGPIAWTAAAGRKLLAPILGCTVPIGLGDVMAVVARKRGEPQRHAAKVASAQPEFKEDAHGQEAGEHHRAGLQRGRGRRRVRQTGL